MKQARIKIYKNKWFVKFARKEGISDVQLCQVVKEVEAGKIDADYGGGVIKQRISRPNEGKSGGYRSIILYRRGNRAFFVYGFSKSKRNNISEAEKREFKELARITFSLPESALMKLIKAGVYQEAQCDGEE